jgi:2,5-diketo-D-gluconate reductase A
MTVPTVALNTGAAMPQLGFGVFQVHPRDTEAVVATALEAGYRLIDTAAMYRNEDGVGRAVAASGIARDELFVTTKLDNPTHRSGDVERAFEQSLQRLGLDCVDLYLIHWPLPAADRYVQVWSTLAKFAEDGRARAIGVSNFQIAHLQRLLDETEIVPAVNQVELHPYLTQEPLRRFHAEHGIVTEAWSPLGQGGELLAEPTITGIAEKYGITPAQVVLRWHLQRGDIVFPKSMHRARMEENFAIFDVELTDDDLTAIAGLNRDERTGPDPTTFDGR